MTDHADLTARLRPRAKPGWVVTGTEAGLLIDALDAADAENARLTAERDEALAEVAQLRDERSAALALLDIHAKDPFHPDVRAALRVVLAVSEEATDG